MVGVCLSHSKTVEIVKELGKDHDDTVKRWKHNIEVMLGGETMLDLSTHSCEESDNLESDEDDMDWISSESSESSTGMYCVYHVHKLL